MVLSTAFAQLARGIACVVRGGRMDCFARIGAHYAPLTVGGRWNAGFLLFDGSKWMFHIVTWHEAVDVTFPSLTAFAVAPTWGLFQIASDLDSTVCYSLSYFEDGPAASVVGKNSESGEEVFRGSPDMMFGDKSTRFRMFLERGYQYVKYPWGVASR